MEEIVETWILGGAFRSVAALWNQVSFFFMSSFLIQLTCALRRTMKSNVKNELTIPQQTRYLVGIELGKIERHVRGRYLPKAILIRILTVIDK
jgi:hypothetical protein